MMTHDPDNAVSATPRSCARRRLAVWTAIGLMSVALLAAVIIGSRPQCRRALRLWRTRRAQRNGLRSLLAKERLPAGIVVEGGRAYRLIDGAEMVLIPSGRFVMGDDENRDERPVRTVTLSAYLIDVHEVTNRQFKQFVNSHPQWRPGRVDSPTYLPHWSTGTYPPGREAHPVHHVSWEAALAYAEWVGATLPTEAQWEKAARGGLAGKQFPWGDGPDPTMANWGRPRWPHNQPGRPCEAAAFLGAKFDSSSTTPVGAFPANGYGLHDVAGNVWEWCLDFYDPRFYHDAPPEDPAELRGVAVFDALGWGQYVQAHVARGGSWFRRPAMCRCANRSYDHFVVPAIAELSDYYYGFRCAIPLASTRRAAYSAGSAAMTTRKPIHGSPSLGR